MGERVSYPVTGRLTYSTTSGFNGGVSVVPGQMGATILAPIAITGNLIQTNQLAGAVVQVISVQGGISQTNQIAAAIAATLAVAGDLQASGYTPSLDFSDARNSMYL